MFFNRCKKAIGILRFARDSRVSLGIPEEYGNAMGKEARLNRVVMTKGPRLPLGRQQFWGSERRISFGKRKFCLLPAKRGQLVHRRIMKQNVWKITCLPEGNGMPDSYEICL